MHFRKSHICANKLDVQETDLSLTHSSTETEIISLDAGSRMDGIPALALFGIWWLKYFIPYRTRSNNPRKSSRETRCRLPSQTSTTSSNSGTPTSPQPTLTTFQPTQCMLNVFEGNEAVIKMIIKGRSPTVRHVSRTNRVALDWLFDRMNLHPKIQIKYIDSKHQLADILTKGNFTRDEWNNLLHLFNISHFSSLRCTKNFSLICCITMAKRIQEPKEGERVASKWPPAVMNTSSYLIATSSNAASSPIATTSLGMSGASGKPGRKQVHSTQLQRLK